MTKKRATDPPAYRLFLSPSVHKARKRLPGKVRHRIGRSLDRLALDPRAPGSRQLRLPDGMQPPGSISWEVRRLRVEDYRVVYAIDDTWKEIAVLAVEKRPPYAYEDLEELLADLMK